MSFVAAAATLRMAVFGIAPLQSRFQLKGIAGNIGERGETLPPTCLSVLVLFSTGLSSSHSVLL
jgi:hypothetical protein